MAAASLSLRDEYEAFVTKYWPLAKLQTANPPSSAHLAALRRGVWYCNISGTVIPALQVYNVLASPEAVIVDGSGAEVEKLVIVSSQQQQSQLSSPRLILTEDDSAKASVVSGKPAVEFDNAVVDVSMKKDDQVGEEGDEEEQPADDVSNEAESQNEAESEGDDHAEVPLSQQLWNRGHDTHHVFACGHCFGDIYILSGMFDYLRYPYAHIQDLKVKGAQAVDEYIVKKLTSYFTSCMYCNYDFKPPALYNQQLVKYGLSCHLSCGTVIRSPLMVPKRLLGALRHELQKDDVVDTQGYRGVGLYLYHGDGKFEHLEPDEYYARVPLVCLQRRGYLYYLCASPQTTWVFGFGNGVVMNQYADFYDDGEDGEDDEDENVKEGRTIRSAFQTLVSASVTGAGSLRIVYRSKDDVQHILNLKPSITSNESYVHELPFSSVAEVQALQLCGYRILVPLHAEEQMILDKSSVCICSMREDLCQAGWSFGGHSWPPA